MNKALKRGLYTFGILILILLFVRIISPSEIDDLHPNIPCPEIQKYNPDVLWVIPLYEETPISNSKEWCEGIKNLNKTLGLHGISHSYREFLQTQNAEDLNKGIAEFESCFGYKPELFKAPQLKINLENKALVKESGLKLKGKFSQTTHKVYHCDDQGILPNWLINVF